MSKSFIFCLSFALIYPFQIIKVGANMLKFVICEDSTSMREKYKNMLECIFEKNNIDAEVAFETDNPEQLYIYFTKNHVDVALLDIDLKAQMTGLDLAKKIREINKSASIVFITAHIEYALLAFKVNTFDYLIKPVSPQKLEECILRLAQFANTDPGNYIKLRSGTSTYLVKLNDIIYIEKVISKSFIYTVNEIIETYYTLEDLEKYLPSNFFRSHRSYIVNINKISKFDSVKNELVFVNSSKCYVGRKYRKEVLKLLEHIG